VIRKDIVLFLEEHDIINRGLPVSEALVEGKKHYYSKKPITKPLADSGDAQESSSFLIDRDANKLKRNAPSFYELLKAMSESQLYTVRKTSSSSSTHHKEKRILRRHTTFALSPKSRPKRARTAKRLKRRSVEKWKFECLKNKTHDQSSSSRSTSYHWTSASSSGGSRKHRTPKIPSEKRKLQKKPPICNDHTVKSTIVKTRGRKSAPKEPHSFGAGIIRGEGAASNKFHSSGDKSTYEATPKEFQWSGAESISGEVFKASYSRGEESIHVENIPTKVQQIGVLKQSPLNLQKSKEPTPYQSLSNKKPDTLQRLGSGKECKLLDTKVQTEGDKRQPSFFYASVENIISEESIIKDNASQQDIKMVVPTNSDHSLVSDSTSVLALEKKDTTVLLDMDVKDEASTVYEELCKSYDIF